MMPMQRLQRLERGVRRALQSLAGCGDAHARGDAADRSPPTPYATLFVCLRWSHLLGCIWLVACWSVRGGEAAAALV